MRVAAFGILRDACMRACVDACVHEFSTRIKKTARDGLKCAAFMRSME